MNNDEIVEIDDEYVNDDDCRYEEAVESYDDEVDDDCR